MTDHETAQKFADILQDAVLENDPTINLNWRRMFGGAGYFANGIIFAAWFRGHNIALKLPDQARDDLLQVAGAQAVSKHYVEVPESFLEDNSLLAQWAARSMEYVKSLPVAKKRR